MNRILSKDEEKSLAERIAASVKHAPFRAGRFSLTCTDLPFYKQGYDVRIKCFTTMPIITKEYVCDDTHVFETDGEPEALDKINKALSLSLNMKNIIAYVDFYFQKVAVDDDFAILISSLDDFPYNDEFNDELTENLEKLITAPKAKKTEDGFSVTAFVLLDDTLFKSDISVSQDGTVNIDDEEIVYDSLPVQRIILR